MRKTIVQLLVAVIVVFGGIPLHHSVEAVVSVCSGNVQFTRSEPRVSKWSCPASSRLNARANNLLAIGTSPMPLPPPSKLLAIGTSPMPLPPPSKLLAIGTSPMPLPPPSKLLAIGEWVALRGRRALG